MTDNKQYIINLEEATGGKVKNISGKPKGLAFRKKYNLDKLDNTEQKVKVLIPEEVYSISTSFFLGFFSKSVQALGSKEAFLNKYEFSASKSVFRDINEGIKDSLSGE